MSHHSSPPSRLAKIYNVFCINCVLSFGKTFCISYSVKSYIICPLVELRTGNFQKKKLIFFPSHQLPAKINTLNVLFHFEKNCFQQQKQIFIF